MSSARRYTLKLSCPDRVGIVASVSAFISAHGGWITEANYYADAYALRFFMRQEILADSLPFDIAELRTRFAALAQEFGMEWTISDSAQKKTRCADGVKTRALPIRPAFPLACARTEYRNSLRHFQP